MSLNSAGNEAQIVGTAQAVLSFALRTFPDRHAADLEKAKRHREPRQAVCTRGPVPWLKYYCVGPRRSA